MSKKGYIEESKQVENIHPLSLIALGEVSLKNSNPDGDK